MHRLLRRLAAALSTRTSWRRVAAFSLLTFAAVTAAHAVVVRGRVTDALGKPVPGARVELIQNGKLTAQAVAGRDGTFEVHSSQTGRFTLLTAANGFLPAIGEEFYGGGIDVVAQDVVMSTTSVRQEISVSETLIPTPLPQTTQPLSLVTEDDLRTRVGLTEELRQQPGVALVQQGQYGGITSLFIRGGQSTSNKVLIDGVPAEDVGGRFDYGTVSSTAIRVVETDRGPDSALYGSDALAGVVSLQTTRGGTARPLFVYSGDDGNLRTYRNEIVGSGTRGKFDYLAGFSRFDTSNALPGDKYHSATPVANIGYALTDRTLLRGTVRYGVSASGVPGAHDFLGISANAKQSDQDLYTQGTVENRTLGDWHNLVRYSVARKREEFTTFAPVGTPVVSFGYATYYGNVVTIRGANGLTVTGQSPVAYGGNNAALPFYGATFPQAYLLVSNRDEVYYQSDKSFGNHLTGLFGFRYENERGAYQYPIYGTNQALQRTNFEYTAQLQGDIRSRFFYSLGGSLEKNHLYGTRGTPRLGFAFAPVRPGAKWFHGTRLRFNFAEGVQEPDLNSQFGSLYGALTQAGNTAALAAYGVRPIGALTSRTYDGGIDQNIRANLILKAGYFHSQYGNQIEYVSSSALQTYFGIPCKPVSATCPAVNGLYGAYLNSLTYRAQGAESELQWQPTTHFFLRAGYTYLATFTEKSFSSDALRVAGSTTNPAFPGITIGASSPLAGARVFRRPPSSGFAAVNYARGRGSLSFRGSFESKADDSTFLATPLLLPNRDLDFGYAKLDVSGIYNVSTQVSAFAEVDNILNNQHIGPIGYPGLPVTVRAGLKVRFGGD